MNSGLHCPKNVRCWPRQTPDPFSYGYARLHQYHFVAVGHPGDVVDKDGTQHATSNVSGVCAVSQHATPPARPTGALGSSGRGAEEGQEPRLERPRAFQARPNTGA